MAWYNLWGGKTASIEADEEKLNPAQRYFDGKITPSLEPSYSYEKAYEDLEVVNRGVNMIVDDCSEPHAQVGEQLSITSAVTGIRGSRVSTLLNKQPNLFQDVSTFRRNIFTDYIIDGNIFIYFDGAHLYHLPANKMTIHSSDRTYVQKYTFEETVDFKPSEIIHVKENSFYSIYRGTSRLKPALRTMILMKNMRDFQDNFFKNGAVPGLILKSPNTLSEKIKDRMIRSWQDRYSPNSGGKRPLILDGGMEIGNVADINFKELDFQAAIGENDKIILKALGIPPIMMDSGNNANLRPNMRLYYIETIMPIVKKLNSAYERFFGFEITEDVSHIAALQPELRDQSQYYSALVNTGIITPNEARLALNFDKIEGFDELRVPANIAGSAANPDEGGRPAEEEEKP